VAVSAAVVVDSNFQNPVPKQLNNANNANNSTKKEIK
jgi:hypothetical protein